MKMLKLQGLLVLATMGVAVCGAPAIHARLDRPDGVYKIGEPAELSVRLTGAPEVTRVRFELKNANWETVRSGIFDGAAPWSLPIPGSKIPTDFHVYLNAVQADGRTPLKPPVRGWAGMAVSPEQFRCTAAEPGDFAAFWASQLAELKKIPMNPVVKPIENYAKYYSRYENGRRVHTMMKPGVHWPFRGYDVTVNCVPPNPVRGVLVIPEKATPKSLPLLVVFQGAGGNGTDSIGISGAIVFYVNRHGIDGNRAAAWYLAKNRGELNGYMYQGCDNPATYYMRGVYLRAVRALEFARTVPEWNGRDLIVEGTSFGGAQSIAAAALDPGVTLCIANDPAMCDHAAPTEKPARKAGWPQLLDSSAGRNNREAVLRCAGYYDTVFFARRIKVPTFVATGYMDQVCPSPGVIRAFYELKSAEKQLTTAFDKTHCGTWNLPGYRKLEGFLRAKQ